MLKTTNTHKCIIYSYNISYILCQGKTVVTIPNTK